MIGMNNFRNSTNKGLAAAASFLCCRTVERSPLSRPIQESTAEAYKARQDLEACQASLVQNASN